MAVKRSLQLAHNESNLLMYNFGGNSPMGGNKNTLMSWLWSPDGIARKVGRGICGPKGENHEQLADKVYEQRAQSNVQRVFQREFMRHDRTMRLQREIL